MFGDMSICSCNGCGHVFNAGFETARSEEIYTSQIPTNVPVDVSMTQGLRDTVQFVMPDASQDEILEIGGGSGDLARLFAERSRTVTLVEPGLSEEFAKHAPDNLRVRREMFPEPSENYRSDLGVLRQVLEHVARPVDFLGAAVAGLAISGRCYVEVPCIEYIAENASPVDLHYMHVHYFSDAVLRRIFSEAGLTVVDRRSVKDGHDVGYLLEKTGDDKGEKEQQSVETIAPDWLRRMTDRLNTGHEQLMSLSERRVGLYGACAYSQSLTGFYPDILVPAIVLDDTPEYHGKQIFWGGGTCPVSLPSAAAIKDIDAVIITAYLHDKVIAEKLRSLNFDGEILSVRADGQAGTDGHPPSLFV